MAGFVNRENRVPHYQRLFQKHDGLRQWEKTRGSRTMLRAYYAVVWTTILGSQYAMMRMVLGHKTWFSKD